jgi:hypothetical protein
VETVARLQVHPLAHLPLVPTIPKGKRRRRKGRRPRTRTEPLLQSKAHLQVLHPISGTGNEPTSTTPRVTTQVRKSKKEELELCLGKSGEKTLALRRRKAPLLQQPPINPKLVTWSGLSSQRAQPLATQLS